MGKLREVEERERARVEKEKKKRERGRGKEKGRLKSNLLHLIEIPYSPHMVG